MKHIPILIALLFFGQVALAQTIPIDSAKNYEGKAVTICSVVQSTYVSKGENKTTMLNFGNPFPNQTFVAVIFADDALKFSYKPSEFLQGKNVCITGTIKIYKDKPEIVITDPSQIKIIEK